MTSGFEALYSPLNRSFTQLCQVPLHQICMCSGCLQWHTRSNARDVLVGHEDVITSLSSKAASASRITIDLPRGSCGSLGGGVGAFGVFGALFFLIGALTMLARDVAISDTPSPGVAREGPSAIGALAFGWWQRHG